MESYIEKKFKAWKIQLSSELQYVEYDYNQDFTVENCFCIESGLIENNYGYLIYLPKKDSSYRQISPKKFDMPKIDQCSVVTIASENKPYIDFLYENLRYNIIDKEIVFYGQDPEIYQQGVNFYCFNDELHMAQARNRGIDRATSDYLFILDIDTMLTKEEFSGILKKYGTLLHYGVFCLRNNKRGNAWGVGNSFYFGLSSFFKQTKFDERFKKFFFEDTEYLMNWSRVGIPIVHINAEYDKKTHDSIKDSGVNFNTFREIALKGR